MPNLSLKTEQTIHIESLYKTALLCFPQTLHPGGIRTQF
jgi:hypothetical protein